MVEKDMKNSISGDETESQFTKANGKRVAEDSNKDPNKRQKTRGLFRQPTVNELNRLQETENLFNSNLFRLQIEEILQEVKVTEKTEKKFKQWFADFKTHLDSIPDDNTEYDLTEKTLAKKLKVKIPIPSTLDKTKCVFKFQRFKDVQLFGSYSLECAINSNLRIDIQLTVPSETYTKNDSINYRYHKKRAAYLACIASHLKSFQSIDELNYTYINGSETKPVIDIKPTGKLANHFSVRIHLYCEEDAYKLHRFSPPRNNLRETWLFSEEKHQIESKKSQNDSEIGSPTPYYNSTILSDITAPTNEELLKEVLLKSENLKQAVVLLKIWLRQRKLQVSGHVVSMLVAYLVQNKRINNIMSSYQIVRNVWIALKTSDWDTKGISLHKATDTPSPELQSFLEHFPVVFLDRTGYYNLTYQMNKGTYSALKRESGLAVEMLDNGKINSFIPLFMVPVQPVMQFEHVLRFKNLPALKESILKRSSKETQLNYGVDQLALITDNLYSLLAKGLANRIDLILPLVEADFSWSVKKSAAKAKGDGQQEKLSFGFILNPEHATNVVEKGPPANLPEAEEFRAFWGAKSELRRFQDGSITETVVWEADTLAERRALTVQIVDYLMQHKYDIPPTDLFHITNQLDSILVRKHSPSRAQCEALCAEAVRAFDELRRDLRGLQRLPIDISAVYGVSPVFSYCEPVPCVAATAGRHWVRHSAALAKDSTDGKLPPYVAACKAVVELGHSGKWPGDIEAFRCLKAAFNLQIADRLNKQYSLPTQAYKTHIDVLKSGLVFRLEIAHPKEIILLRRVTEKGVVKHIDSEESVKLQRETVLLPRLRGALHGLHQQHPSYGPTCCLLKRWLAAHLFSTLFPATVCELLTAAVYLHPEPYTAPMQPLTGFMRVLKLIGETDWSNEMLMLDFNGDLTREELNTIEQAFTTRDRANSPALYIVTSQDGDCPSIWSRDAPTKRVLNRVQVLANSAKEYICKATEKGDDNILPIFIPSLTGYDVLIHLHPHLVPHASERVDKRCDVRVTDQPIADDVIPVVEFNVVDKYLEELKSAYDDFAIFFHDTYGGDVIAVLWRPDVREPREFQLTNANALCPSKNKDGVYRVNTDAIVEDFRILGQGLVKEVTVTTR